MNIFPGTSRALSPRREGSFPPEDIPESSRTIKVLPGKGWNIRSSEVPIEYVHLLNNFSGLSPVPGTNTINIYYTVDTDIGNLAVYDADKLRTVQDLLTAIFYYYNLANFDYDSVASNSGTYVMAYPHLLRDWVTIHPNGPFHMINVMGNYLFSEVEEISPGIYVVSPRPSEEDLRLIRSSFNRIQR